MDDKKSELNKRSALVLSQMCNLIKKYKAFETQNELVHEYVFHGFIRRINLMKTCIKNVFCLLPLDREKALSREKLDNLYINLHAYIINSYGCLDNLAKVWVEEKNVLDSKGNPLKPMNIGMSKGYKDVRNSFSKDFEDVLIKNSPVFETLENYRHALAHRIPLYVPPAEITPKEQERIIEIEHQIIECILKGDQEGVKKLKNEKSNIGKVCFQMRHSFSENASLDGYLHDHILDIWDSVTEIADGFINELSISKSNVL